MKKALLFDFDGVIANTFNLTFGISQKNEPELTEQGFRDRFNGNYYEAIKHLETKGKIENLDFWADYVPRLATHTIDDAIKSTVQKLSNDYDLFIISSSLSTAIADFLNRHGISDCFKEILGKEVHKSKIHKINLVLEKYKLTSQDCLFVTDTIGDIIEARQCNVRSVAVTWGYHSKESLSMANPDGIANNPADLPSITEKLFKRH